MTAESLRLAAEPDVWLFPLDVEVDETVLAPDEVARGERYRFERDRRRFRRRRAHLRHLLARYTDVPAQHLRLLSVGKGKPALDLAGAPCFSATSSGDLCAIAVSPHEVGLDLELIVPTSDLGEVARRLFAAEEVAAISSAADFYRCWSRKEAYVKGIGQGLTFPLASFAVEVGDLPRPRLLRSDFRPDDVRSCEMTDLSSPDGEFAAALLAFGPTTHVIM